MTIKYIMGYLKELMVRFETHNLSEKNAQGDIEHMYSMISLTDIFSKNPHRPKTTL